MKTSTNHLPSILARKTMGRYGGNHIKSKATVDNPTREVNCALFD